MATPRRLPTKQLPLPALSLPTEILTALRQSLLTTLPTTPLMTNSSQSDSAIVAASEEPGAQMTFFEHLVELRKRIINSLASIVIGSAIGWVIAPHFVNLMVKPMVKALANAHLNPQLVYSHPAGYVTLLITCSIYIGIVIASPWVLFQVWQFVAPALYKHERSAITGFFVLHCFFCFWRASPLAILFRCRMSCAS